MKDPFSSVSRYSLWTCTKCFRKRQHRKADSPMKKSSKKVWDSQLSSNWGNYAHSWYIIEITMLTQCLTLYAFSFLIFINTSDHFPLHFYSLRFCGQVTQSCECVHDWIIIKIKIKPSQMSLLRNSSSKNPSRLTPTLQLGALPSFT